MKTISFFIAILFISCSDNKAVEDNVFFVSNYYQARHDSFEKGLLPGPLPPPIPFYMNHQFLVDSAGQLYYYQLDQIGWFCGTGYDYKIPQFIGLTPTDVIHVPESDISQLVKTNILNQDYSVRWVVIGLQKDTIKSNALAILTDIFKSDFNIVKWDLRKMTFEESIVLDFKRKRKSYKADNVLWDTSKIILIKPSVKFSPPKTKAE